MSEENVNAKVETAEKPAPSAGAKIWAGIKEWFRKRIVKLKQKPQTIAMLFLLVALLFWLCTLNVYSSAIYSNDVVENKLVGLLNFVTTLFAILSVVSFLNAFPKRKKPNIVFIIITFAFIAIQIVCDAFYHVNFSAYLYGGSDLTPEQIAESPEFLQSLNFVIVHIVLLGVAAGMIALTPVFGILLKKINTKKAIESTELKEEIDTSEEV